MKIILIAVGKTEETYMKEGVSKYVKRLKHYIGFDIKELPASKVAGKTTEHRQRQLEGVELLKHVSESDRVILLDEGGTGLTSTGFAEFLQKGFNKGGKRFVFLVGGPFGFSDEIRARSNSQLSLSKMTFSHQMVRLFFVEQLYRAMTILKGEGYHH